MGEQLYPNFFKKNSHKIVVPKHSQLRFPSLEPELTWPPPDIGDTEALTSNE